MRKPAILLVLFLVVTSAPCYAMGKAPAVRKANKLYRKKDYDRALKIYDNLEKKAPESDIINFNNGTVLYKKGDYEDAVKNFGKALKSNDSVLEQKINYNLGNAKFKKAEKIEEVNLDGAIADLKASVDYFSRAKELDEKDEDAKYNHKLAKKKLEELLKKREQQQKQQEQQKQGQKDQEKQQQKQEQEQKDQEQQKQGQQAQRDQQRKEEEKAEGEEQEQETPFKAYRQEDQKEARPMSEKQAQMLLNRQKQEEEAARAQKMKRKVGVDHNVLKDW